MIEVAVIAASPTGEPVPLQDCPAHWLRVPFCRPKINVLPAGEAGVFVIPMTAEGIGTCPKNGFLAAESTIQATKSGDEADRIYFSRIQPITAAYREYSLWFHRIEEAVMSGGGVYFCEVLAEAHEESLKIR